MRLQEAFQQGILKVRLPVWNRYAYIEILPLGNGYMGPWVKLWDVFTPGEMLPAFQADCDEFEAWVQPEDFRPEVYQPREEKEAGR
jgi:hypothetical protein